MDRFVQNVVSRYMYSFDTFFRVSKSTVEAILWWRFNIFQNCYSEKQLMDDLKFHMKLDKFTDNAVVHRITRTNTFTVNCWSKCFWIDILSVASEGGVGVRPFINLDKQPPPPPPYVPFSQQKGVRCFQKYFLHKLVIWSNMMCRL